MIAPIRSFRSRLLLVFAAGFVALFLVGAYGVVTYRDLLTRMNAEQQLAGERLRRVGEIATHYAQQNLAWANLLLRGQEPDEYHRQLGEFYENERRTIESAERLLEQLAQPDALQALTAQFVHSLHELRAQYRQALRIYNGSKQSQTATDQFLSAITRRPTEMLAQIEQLMVRQHDATLQALYQEARGRELTLALVSAVMLAALLLAILWLIDAQFARPMSRAIATARQVAAGRVEERIPVTGSGEFGAFAEAFNHMIDRLARANAELETHVRRLRVEIVQREQIEQALRQQQQALSSANRELEAFSYTVSHDLRAPLRAIDGFARVLHDEYGARLDAEGLRCLDRVRRGAQRMGVLIDELLELSRVSRVALAPTTVDLSALAQEVVAELAASEPQRQVNVEIAPQLNAWGDEELLRIVLANLIGNAWKYTRRQIAAYIEFSRAAERDEAVFYVRDNGAGFDMKYAAQLFRPFQRLHTDSEFEGTGIGLATVERIIRRHGGRIWADAAPDRGATFQFTLPMGV